ncbi:MAG: four helix bundle protein [Paludibacteraceae bacterium]|nr:four helix bundle protein [Paludibacteraceae bacterium]
METKYTYKDLDAYRESKILVKLVYGLLREFPREEQYALCDQLRRAVISIPSNLAEGSGRYSVKEQLHFIEIAYGSLLEVECQMDIAYDLGYISNQQLLDVTIQIGKVAALLSGLRSKRLSLTR